MFKKIAIIVFSFIAVISLGLTAACNGNGGTSGENSAPVYVDGVCVCAVPLKTVYLKGEAVDVSGGSIGVIYSDGKEQLQAMSAESVTAPTEEYGEHQATVKITVEGREYTLSFGYYVVSTEAVRDYVELNVKLPYMNAVGIDHVDGVIAVQDAFNALSSQDKAFLQGSFERLLTKADLLEERIMGKYLTSLKNGQWQRFDRLNAGNYTAANYDKIAGYITQFEGKSFTSLKQIKAEDEQLTARIDAVERKTDDPTYSLADYKADTVAAIESLFKAEVYSVDAAAYNTSAVRRESEDLSKDGKYAESYSETVAAVNAAADYEGVDIAYAEANSRVRAICTEKFKQSLKELFSAWRDTVEEYENTWEEPTISVIGLYEGISMDDMADNRWWIPEPYRMDVLLNGIDGKMDSARTLKELKEFYSAYAFELLRTAMQRNMEIYYALGRNAIPTYDASDVLQWNIICTYYGDTHDRSFVYNGILDEFVGNTYGANSETAYRFCAELFQPGLCPSTLEGLVVKYNEAMTKLTPPPEAVDGCTVVEQPSVIIYQLGERLSVEGAVAEVWTTYGNVKRIEITDEMWNQAEADGSTAGVKTVNVEFEAFGSKLTASILLIVVEDSPVASLVEGVYSLPSPAEATVEDVPAVEACIAQYNALNEENKGVFENAYAELSGKLIGLQQALMYPYVKANLCEVQAAYEKMNYYDYAEQTRHVLDEKYTAVCTEMVKADTFEQARGLFATYVAEVEALEKISDTENDMAILRANAVKSADRITEVEIYKIGGKLTELGIVLEKTSLKSVESVQATYSALVAMINGAKDKAELNEAYESGVIALHAAVTEAYRAAALESVRGVVVVLRDSVKSVWEGSGFSGSGNVTLDYMDSVGEYLWFTPNEFKVADVYAKLAINAEASKADVADDYHRKFFEMLRVTMYRNLYTVFHCNLSLGLIRDTRWESLYAYNSPKGQRTYEYDGAIEAFKGTVIGASADYRLWCWGFNINEKATTVEELVYKYNFDLAKFLPQSN